MSSRRARGRGNARGGRQQNIRNQQMDSNGPGGRIRGTPQQVLDRYLALARDASSAGDSVLAENLLQHAEHYTRLLNAAAPAQQQNQPQNQHQGNGRDDQDYDSDDTADGYAAAPAAANGYDEQPAQQGADAGGQPAEQPAAPDQPPEWTAGDQPAGGEQPSAPPRRRRRSRFQRQQEQDGGDSGMQTGSAGGAEGDNNPVPPIDLSAAAESAPVEVPRETGDTQPV
jgi:hypothetical protein